MKVFDITTIIEEFAPKSLSYEYVKKYGGYDNCGLLVGSMDCEITGIVLCLDVTDSVIDFALERGANFIFSHHPFIYSPLCALTTENAATVLKAVRHNINVYSAHLNLDIARGGVNDELARLIGMKNCVPMFEVGNTGLGRVGDIGSITLAKLEEKVRDVLDDKTVWASGTRGAVISRIAVIAGSGGGDTENLVAACRAGADAFLSSEFKHYLILQAREMGLALISASHYAEEKPALGIVQALLLRHGLASDIAPGQYPYI